MEKQNSSTNESASVIPVVNKTGKKYPIKIISVACIFLIIVALIIIGFVKASILHTKFYAKNDLSFNPKTTLLMTIPSDCALNRFAIFSPNGRSVAFYCAGNTNELLLSDKNEKNGIKAIYGNFSDIEYLSQYNNYAYSASNWIAKSGNTINTVILNGRELGQYSRYSSILPLEYLSSPSPRDAPDASLFYNGHPAFTVYMDNNIQFIYDGKVVATNGTIYKSISEFAVSGDGKHYAFFAIKKGQTEDTSFLVRDGKETKVDGDISSIHLNQDGSKIAYVY